MWCWHGCLRPQCSAFGHWCFCGGASTPKHLAKESRCAADSHGLCSLYVKQISDVWIIRQLQTPGISLTTLHHSLLGYFVFIVLISSCKHHLNSLRWPASAHGHCCWFVSCILCKRETCTSHHTYVIHYVGGCYCWGTAMRSFCLKVFIFIKSLNFFLMNVRNALGRILLEKLCIARCAWKHFKANQIGFWIERNMFCIFPSQFEIKLKSFELPDQTIQHLQQSSCHIIAQHPSSTKHTASDV